MLFIYGALPVGGIETFFMRMAKERHRLGLSTYILLLSKPEKSNKELLNEMKKYAKVLFIEDLFNNISILSIKFPLLLPVNKNSLSKVMANVSQVHVFDGMHALLGYRLINMSGKNIPLTIGFYHYIKYLWGGEKVAWHERVNRKFIFDYLPKQSLLFFSDGNRELYIKHKKLDFKESNVFRLGVIDKKAIALSGELSLPLKIIAVGRLVEFKTYNFYMIDVISNLLEKGIDVQFDIYGDGPMQQSIQQKIEEANLEKRIQLKGTLDYSQFDKIVTEYDLFIGSGTAIIQAAALGIPSIVGVENTEEAMSYGYFCDVCQYEYNLKGLDIPLIKVDKLIESYCTMADKNRLKLKEKHHSCIDAFTNENCQQAMDKLNNIEMPINKFKFNRWLYVISFVIDKLNMRYNKRHPRVTQFEDFRQSNEK